MTVIEPNRRATMAKASFPEEAGAAAAAGAITLPTVSTIAAPPDAAAEAFMPAQDADCGTERLRVHPALHDKGAAGMSVHHALTQADICAQQRFEHPSIHLANFAMLLRQLMEGTVVGAQCDGFLIIHNRIRQHAVMIECVRQLADFVPPADLMAWLSGRIEIFVPRHMAERVGGRGKEAFGGVAETGHLAGCVG